MAGLENTWMGVGGMGVSSVLVVDAFERGIDRGGEDAMAGAVDIERV